LDGLSGGINEARWEGFAKVFERLKQFHTEKNDRYMEGTLGKAKGELVRKTVVLDRERWRHRLGPYRERTGGIPPQSTKRDRRPGGASKNEGNPSEKKRNSF